MAKRSNRSLDNQYVESILEPVKSDIDPEPQVTYNYVTNRLPSRVIRYGAVTGIRYEWKPGECVEVRSEDADALRNLKLGGRPCCASGPTDNLIFDVSED